MALEATCPALRGKDRMLTLDCQEMISRLSTSHRAAAGNSDQTCSNELKTQSDYRFDSMHISSDITIHRDCDATGNAADTSLGTSSVRGRSSGTKRTHRKLKCSKLFAHMLEASHNKDSISSTDCTSTTDADHFASVLRTETRRSDVDNQVHKGPSGQDRSSDAYLFERKRDKALRFAMLVVALSNLGIQVAQLM